MGVRVPEFVGVVGYKGVGKTYTTTKIIKQYVLGTDGMQPRRALVYDVNKEFTFIKSIPLKYLRLFSAHPQIQARRVLPFTNTGREFSPDEKQEVLDYILHNYSNGLLLIEDFYNYTSDSMKRDIIGTMTSQRHKNLDIIIHSQGLGRLLHPKLVQQYSWLRLHLAEDSILRYKERATERFDIILIAENLVKIINKRLPEKKKYFYANIDFHQRKIDGIFTKEELLQAIDQYIYLDERASMGRLLSMKDDKGKKKYTYQQAFSVKRSELLQEYYRGTGKSFTVQ